MVAFLGPFCFFGHLSLVSGDPVLLCAQLGYKAPLEEEKAAVNF